jgi:periplasmic divalent cation tolerance protein
MTSARLANIVRMEFYIVYCTCPDIETARRISSTLVKEKLAACVNMTSPLTSIYTWQGTVEEHTEILLLIKTTKTTYPALEMRIIELHPYELPEIIAVSVKDGLNGYLDWIKECTS